MTKEDCWRQIRALVAAKAAHADEAAVDAELRLECNRATRDVYHRFGKLSSHPSSCGMADSIERLTHAVHQAKTEQAMWQACLQLINEAVAAGGSPADGAITVINRSDRTVELTLEPAVPQPFLPHPPTKGSWRSDR